MMSRITDLSLADAWVRAQRYRPVVVTVALTLAALRLAPGGELAASDAAIAAPSPIAAPGPVAPGPSATPDGDRDLPAPLATPRPLGPGPAAGPGPSPSSAGSGLTGVAPVASTPPTPSASPDALDRGQPAGVPSVRHTAWASLSAGTPLAAVGVPDSALPIGNRLGQLDKASFLALDGEWSTLVLTEDPEGTSRQLGEAGLRACPITTADWSAGAEQRFADAPQWSSECVEGTVADRTWTFPIGALGQTHGVALLPAVDAPVDFQIALVDPLAVQAD